MGSEVVKIVSEMLQLPEETVHFHFQKWAKESGTSLENMSLDDLRGFASDLLQNAIHESSSLSPQSP